MTAQLWKQILWFAPSSFANPFSLALSSVDNAVSYLLRTLDSVRLDSGSGFGDA